ncbi:BTG family protein [Acrasis kona]|uniref:BTG family protein n=1 Tax=Acrasis kona TaxID=1008807 RepID=A0AAW2ZP25_9EUKA
MRNEIRAAAAWWGKQIEKKINSEVQYSLENELEVKLLGHWYEDEPVRGSGYRAILVDELQTDDLLLRVARTCNIPKKDFEDAMPRPVVMFIDPSRVCVKKLDSKGYEYAMVYVNGMDYSNVEARERTPSPTPQNKLNNLPVQQTVMA